ncbi:hypothetical protein [Rhizobium phage RHph_X3_9]|nr:hypothetical protein [Rhizobium phage RHph_X3_9]
MDKVQTANLRLISQELLDELDRAFPGPTVTADADVHRIKWDAAQKAVVDWIKAKAGKSQTIGTPDAMPGRPSTGAVVRLGS